MTSIMAAPVGAASDFKVFTGAMNLFSPPGASDLPLVRMRGSSTERDLHGDTMTRSALESMVDVQENLSVWLNHDYTLPDSLFGVLYQQPEIVTKSGITDLWIVARAVLSNPDAARTYGYIKTDNVKIGCSVGCQVLEYELDGVKDMEDQEEVTWAMLKGAAVYISKVRTVEWSLVGIPANQRSWVENAIKGYFTRTLDKNLAPAVKSLFPGAYRKIITEAFEDPDIQQKYLNVEARPAHGSWMWNPHSDVFDFKAASGTVTPYGRESVAAAFDEYVKAEKMNVLIKADDADKSAQEARSRKYGIGIKETTNVTKPSQWKSVEDANWGDPVNYRYPLPDASHARNALARWGDASNRSQYSSKEQSIVGGRIKRRARALGVEVSDDNKGWEHVEETLMPYAEFKQFWDSVEEIELENSNENLVSTEKGEGTPPPPTNLIPRTPDQPVRTAAPCGPEGDHEAMTGTHTHVHKNYGVKSDGSLHTHEHTHNNDNDHNHTHEGDDGMNLSADDVATLKALVAQLKTKAGPKADADLGAANAAPNWGRVASLAISCDNAIDEILQILGVPDIDDADDSSGLDEARNILDAGKSYQSFLTKAVPSEHLRHAQRAHDAIAAIASGAHCAGAQSVPAEPNQIAGMSDVEHKSLVEHHRLCGIVHDALMKATDSAVCPGDMTKNAGEVHEAHIRAAIETKAIAADDMRHVQRAHDAIATMCAGMHCAAAQTVPAADTEIAGAQSVPAEPNEIAGAQSVPAEPNQIFSYTTKSLPEHHRLCGIVHNSLMKMSGGVVCPGAQKSANPPMSDRVGQETNMQQAEDRAFQSRERDSSLPPIGQTMGFTELQKSIAALTEAFTSLNVKGLQEEMVATRAAAAQTKKEAEDAKAQVENLANMSTGRPTNFNRSLNGVPGSVDLATNQQAGVTDADGTVKRYVPGLGMCRFYPVGVLKDSRPELTSAQLIGMTNREIASYYSGGEATVMIDESVQ